MIRLAGLFLPCLLLAQANFQQKGYVEFRGWGFPDTRYNDSGSFIGEAVVRYDVLYDLAPGLQLSGATETRSDTHRQVERRFRINIDDRGLQRPNFSIRRISLIYNRGPFAIEVGKQLIHWSRTSILHPTDRFVPRDYLTVVDPDALAVTAARVVYQKSSDSFEFVAQPIFTPSRIPLLNQRWTPIPSVLRDIPVNDLGSRVPGGTQWGGRWNHTGAALQMSLSYYDGHHHLPVIEGSIDRRQIDFQRVFPRLRMYGGDVAVPLRGLTFKAESAYFTSSSKAADEYVLYVMQLEKESQKWSLSAGYAGEAVTERRARWLFAPDRGLARAFLGRGSYNINANRSVAIETAARGNGLWMRSEYTEKLNPYWSGKVGFTLIRGEPTDFLGQYRRNSFFNLSLRYSF